MAVDKLHFRNHLDRWCKAGWNPHDRHELHGVSVCLSVCPSVYRYTVIFSLFCFLSFLEGREGTA